MKKIGRLFIVLAILLSDIMCAVVAYNYCALQWGGRYAGYSAPASTAFCTSSLTGLGSYSVSFWRVFSIRSGEAKNKCTFKERGYAPSAGHTLFVYFTDGFQSPSASTLIYLKAASAGHVLVNLTRLCYTSLSR